MLVRIALFCSEGMVGILSSHIANIKSSDRYELIKNVVATSDDIVVADNVDVVIVGVCTNWLEQIDDWSLLIRVVTVTTGRNIKFFVLACEPLNAPSDLPQITYFWPDIRFPKMYLL